LLDVGSGGYPEVRSSHMAVSDKTVGPPTVGLGSSAARYIYMLLFVYLLILSSSLVVLAYN